MTFQCPASSSHTLSGTQNPQYKLLTNSHPEPLSTKGKGFSAMRRNRNDIGNTERLIVILFMYAINQTFSGLKESFSCVLIPFMQLMASRCSLMSSKVDTWRTLSCLDTLTATIGELLGLTCQADVLQSFHLLLNDDVTVSIICLASLDAEWASVVPPALWLVEVQHGLGCEMPTGRCSISCRTESLEETSLE